jgi:hypothetical protein
MVSGSQQGLSDCISSVEMAVNSITRVLFPFYSRLREPRRSAGMFFCIPRHWRIRRMHRRASSRRRMRSSLSSLGRDGPQIPILQLHNSPCHWLSWHASRLGFSTRPLGLKRKLAQIGMVVSLATLTLVSRSQGPEFAADRARQLINALHSGSWPTELGMPLSLPSARPNGRIGGRDRSEYSSLLSRGRDAEHSRFLRSSSSGYHLVGISILVDTISICQDPNPTPLMEDRLKRPKFAEQLPASTATVSHKWHNDLPAGKNKGLDIKLGSPSSSGG